MKILHLSTAESWGGGEQQILYLIEGISRRSPSTEQSLFCSENSPLIAKVQQKKIKTVFYRKGFLYKLQAANLLTNFCRKQSIDLIHIHDSHAHSIAYYSVLFYFNKTTMLLSRKFAKAPSTFSIQKYRLKNIKKIIAVSSSVKKLLESKLKNAKQIDVIYDAVDLSRFEKKVKGLKSEFGLAEQTKVIAYVASLHEGKDHETFLKVAKKIIDQRNDCHFLIVGKGPMKSKIEDSIKAKDISDFVTMTGFRDDVAGLLTQVDLLLFTSRYEALASTVLEAFASGVPVLCSEIAGLNEMAQNEKTALTAAVGDIEAFTKKAVLLIDDEIKAGKLSKEARKYVLGFGLQDFAEKHLKIYKALICALKK